MIFLAFKEKYIEVFVWQKRNGKKRWESHKTVGNSFILEIESFSSEKFLVYILWIFFSEKIFDAQKRVAVLHFSGDFFQEGEGTCLIENVLKIWSLIAIGRFKRSFLPVKREKCWHRIPAFMKTLSLEFQINPPIFTITKLFTF